MILDPPQTPAVGYLAPRFRRKETDNGRVAEEGVHCSGRAGQGRGGGSLGGRTEGGGGGVLALVFVFRSCTASQINLGCLET